MHYEKAFSKFFKLGKTLRRFAQVCLVNPFQPSVPIEWFLFYATLTWNGLICKLNFDYFGLRYSWKQFLKNLHCCIVHIYIMGFGAKATALFKFLKNFELIEFFKNLRTKKNVTLFLPSDR